MERGASPEMHLPIPLFSHFAHAVKRRANLKGHPFEGEVPPVRLRNYTSNLIYVGGFLKPNQMAANYVSKVLAKGESRQPSIPLN